MRYKSSNFFFRKDEKSDLLFCHCSRTFDVTKVRRQNEVLKVSKVTDFARTADDGFKQSTWRNKATERGSLVVFG